MVIDSLESGGKERRMVELIKALSGTYLFEVISLSSANAFPILGELGVPVYVVERSSRWDLSVLLRIHRLIDRTRPDLIHVWDGMTAVYGAILSMWKGIPMINSLITNGRRPSPFSKLWFMKMISFPCSRVILANSIAGLQAYAAPSGRSRCVYNGFNYDRIASLKPPEELRAELGLRDLRVISMVANVTPFKDYDLFLKVALSITSSRDDVVFVAVGGGTLLETFRDRALESEHERIRFVGKRSDVESIVNLSEIGMLLTNASTHAEGISNAILEFMALGKPVIATLTGGTPELVEDGLTGFVVPPHDARKVIEKLELLLDNPSLTQEMGERARSRIETKFSMATMSTAFAEIYRSASMGLGAKQ